MPNQSLLLEGTQLTVLNSPYHSAAFTIPPHSIRLEVIHRDQLNDLLFADEPFIQSQQVDDTKRCLPSAILDRIDSVELITHTTLTGKIQRTAVISMVNGFGVTGEPSVSVSVENDRESIGTMIALRNAVDKVWQLEGYLKAEQISNQG
ncbi:MAG: Gp49 family protein [Shewanella sp.]